MINSNIIVSVKATAGKSLMPEIFATGFKKHIVTIILSTEKDCYATNLARRNYSKL
jgi:hypothetical protein